MMLHKMMMLHGVLLLLLLLLVPHHVLSTTPYIVLELACTGTVPWRHVAE